VKLLHLVRAGSLGLGEVMRLSALERYLEPRERRTIPSGL